MSKFAMLFAGALVSALALSSAASAGVSKYCKLIPSRDLARPVLASSVRTQSVSVPNPSVTKAKGRLTMCTHKVGIDVVAQTSVAAFKNAKAARGEFNALAKRERTQSHVRLVKMSGPWNGAYFLGEDGLLVLKDRYFFHIQYASGAPGYAKITSRTLAGLAAIAARKL